MENPSQYMVSVIRNYFLPSTSKPEATSLIKVHDSKLSQIGDISFPLNPDIWEYYFKTILNTNDGNIFNQKSLNEKDAIQKFLEHGHNWIFPLSEVKLIKDRCSLFLNRRKVIETLLTEVLTSPTYGFQTKDPNKLIRIALIEPNRESLCEYRAQLVSRVLNKLISLSNWTQIIDDSREDVKTISVISVTAPKLKEADSVILLKCGAVLDPQDGKIAKFSPEEYVRLRSKDMRLMAMHKYGIRIKDDKKFCDLIEKLGAAAVNVDLLEVKPSSPVHVIRSGQGSTKGASFILYNSARLETLLRTFEEKVRDGTYQNLPPLTDIDLSLLSNEEEWELIYGYIFTFPNLIQRCIENFDSGSCGIHYLIKYLDGLVSAFSVYYRRTRILTERRTHLMPHVYARIYLLQAIQRIFNTALGLLDIEPVQFM